jgi:hypothetical protein
MESDSSKKRLHHRTNISKAFGQPPRRARHTAEETYACVDPDPPFHIGDVGVLNGTPE